jgi:hypothetical protein
MLSKYIWFRIGARAAGSYENGQGISGFINLENFVTR